MGASTLSSRAIIGEFYRHLAQLTGQSWIDALSMLFTSDQESEEYNWLGQSPVMREWVGGRHAKGFSENGIVIKNLEFEATIEVLLRELKRDKTGQIMTRIRELAQRTQTHWASLLSKLIKDAESSICYDGEYFFDTDHEEDKSGVQSNKISVDISTLPVAHHGSVSAPSVEEMQAAILEGIKQILGFKDDQGEPMNELANKFVVMTPTSLWLPAKNAVHSSAINNGTSNILVNAGDLDVAVAANNRLSDWTDKFVVFRADGEVKPFIRQQEEDVNLDAQAEGSPIEFNEKKHQYGVSCSRNVGLGYWQHACLVNLV